MHLASYFMAKALEKVEKRKESVTSDLVIDQKLDAVKNAYKESFNGEAQTSDQKAKLKASIIDFIKSDSGGL